MSTPCPSVAPCETFQSRSRNTVAIRWPEPFPRLPVSMRIRLAAIVFFALIGAAFPAAAQQQDSAALHAAITARDSALFAAFNRCDTAALEGFFTEDLEFYHDRGGLTPSRKAFIDGYARGCANRQIGRREIMPASLEVHRMRGLGALAIGTHRFFVRTGEREELGDIARFVMLWRNDGGEWRVSRVLSFDHRDQRYVGVTR